MKEKFCSFQTAIFAAFSLVDYLALNDYRVALVYPSGDKFIQSISVFVYLTGRSSLTLDNTFVYSNMSYDFNEENNFTRYEFEFVFD